MRCRNYRRLVVLTTEADLSAEQRASRNRHEAECLACREFDRDMRGVEYLLGLLRGEEAPADFSGAVMRRIGENRRVTRRAGMWGFWRR